MPPSTTLLPLNAGRPRSLHDFDQRLGCAQMVQRCDANGSSVWTSSRGLNVLGLGMMVILGGALLGAFAYRDRLFADLDEADFGARVLIAGLTAALGGAALMGTLLAIHRGKLVIDHARRELRITTLLRPLFRPVIPFDDIRTVCYEQVEGFHDTDFDSIRIYTVLFVELHDGRLACLAIDSPDLFTALEKTISAPAVHSCHTVFA